RPYTELSILFASPLAAWVNPFGRSCSKLARCGGRLRAGRKFICVMQLTASKRGVSMTARRSAVQDLPAGTSVAVKEIAPSVHKGPFCWPHHLRFGNIGRANS